MRINNLLLTSDPLPKAEKPQLPTVIKPGDEPMERVREWDPPDLERK